MPVPPAGNGRGVGRHVCTALTGALVVGLALLPPRGLAADGGTLRVANAQVGGYLVSVFTDPTPVRPDSLDVSLLATHMGRRSLAEGLEIELFAWPIDGSGPFLRHPVTQNQAQDPRYYAAKFRLGSPGEWVIVLRIRGLEGEGYLHFTVRAREPGLLSHPLSVLVASLVPLLVAAWWWKKGEAPPPQTREGIS